MDFHVPAQDGRMILFFLYKSAKRAYIMGIIKAFGKLQKMLSLGVFTALELPDRKINCMSFFATQWPLIGPVEMIEMIDVEPEVFVPCHVIHDRCFNMMSCYILPLELS
jgi:hypothetical protein